MTLEELLHFKPIPGGNGDPAAPWIYTGPPVWVTNILPILERDQQIAVFGHVLALNQKMIEVQKTMLDAHSQTMGKVMEVLHSARGISATKGTAKG